MGVLKQQVPLEHEEQAALVQWAVAATGKHPELKLLYAVPNGARTSMSVAKRLKAEGLKSGVPDLVLPVARGGHHGLYLEMKRRKGGTLSDEQKEWIERLAQEGYGVFVCKGWEQARDVILKYLEMGK